MKKIIAIIIALTVVFTGCSRGKNSDNNSVQNTAKDTISETASLINSQKPQPTPESTPQSTKDTKDTYSNMGTSLLGNIDTTKSPFEKGYYDYQGTISNNMSIQMSVYPLEKDIVGSYFYQSQRKEIKLKGKAGAKDFVLYEYDDTSKNTGIFKGTMKTIDKIEGTWISADNKTSYPFTLSLKSNIPGVEYGKRYALAVGTKSDQEVESFVSKIQGYVINNNMKQFAEEVKYPISVKIDGKVTKIQNENDFIKNYDLIFHNKYKQVISNTLPKYLFANAKGIMFGTGLYNIWINELTPTGGNSKLMITAINN